MPFFKVSSSEHSSHRKAIIHPVSVKIVPHLYLVSVQGPKRSGEAVAVCPSLMPPYLEGCGVSKDPIFSQVFIISFLVMTASIFFVYICIL